MAKLCFFDDYYVASRPATVRRYFRPEKIGEFHDEQASLQLYTSFFYDTVRKKYRLYYEKPTGPESTEIRSLMLAEADRAEDLTAGRAHVTAVEGVGDEIHGASVVFNPDAAPESRYVFFGNVGWRSHSPNPQKSGSAIAFARSADGVHFEKPTPFYREMSDTYNGGFYDPYRREYAVTMRATCLDRRVFMMRSADLVHWSEPRPVLLPAADPGGNGVQHYAMGVSHCGGIFYGVLWRYMTDLGLHDPRDMVGYMENDLYYSYDGETFAPSGLSPLVERPLPPEYGCKQLWLLNALETPEGDRTLLCGGASSICHGSSYAADHFCTTVLYGARRDGFCALEGFGENSVVTTKPFLCEGGELLANYNAAVGDFSVQVLRFGGEVVEGYSFADCDPMAGTDRVRGAVRWGGKDLSALAGQRIRFAIRLNAALLWSIEFDGKPYLAGVQRSFNDPRSPFPAL